VLLVLLTTVVCLVATGLARPGSTLAAEPGQRVRYAAISGSGSTWAQLVLDQWIADVDAAGIRVSYAGTGSSRGRQDFAEGRTDFALTDIPYQEVDEAGLPDTSNGRAFGYVPVVAGGTAFTYWLEVDGRQVDDLRLSGSTIAKIFTRQVTSWDDPAITADNNGRRLPALPITPVVRSDGAGTTAQLTAWFDSQYPASWRPYLGRAGSTAYYPRSDGIVGQAGSDAVISYVQSPSGMGSIAYVENSYAVTRGAPVLKLGNPAGYYVSPTAPHVAVALTGARIHADETDPSTYLTADLSGVWTNDDPRSYPLSAYSYAIVPTGASDATMTTAKRQSLADFLDHALCQGQAKAQAYGYAPLPLNLVRAGFEQVARLGAADPAVDLAGRDVTTCDNPTFDGQDPDRDVLAETAPMPPPCDRQGAGPCGAESGGHTGGPTQPALIRIGFRTPVVRGVHLVRPDRRYLLTVRTNLTARPRYFGPTPRAARFAGVGVAMRPAPSRIRGLKAWRLTVRVLPGATTKKIGIRVGATRTVPLLVRRSR
jgi:phosphate transport system substrate-binding protein